MAEGQVSPKGLMDRLNRLFDTVHPPDRGPYSNAEVAELMEKRGLGKLSGQYLWLLRTGQRDNPTKRHLEALAGFFGVDPAYWFDDAVADPIGQVARVYDAIGLPLTAAAENAMRDWLDVRPREAPRPPYGLDTYGLRPEQVDERFTLYNKRFRHTEQ